ncbi:MAG TPA: SDR family NAD(P)-dependent oxidoreductase [Gaiellaceae bacterium]|nr:SDR family NAD(P)-dependent oxidoreductase [Gaiellaceae bacterium]
MTEALLAGRVAAVTGASEGLGAAYARALAEAGASVVLNARRAKPLEDLAGELPRAAVAAGDVGDPETAERIVEAALSAFGRLDVLVNNAGTLRDRTLLKMSPEEFDDVLRSHVYGTFLVTRQAAPVMREQGSGAIVNVGSDSGMRGAFGQTNYAAAKGAIAAMTLTWAQELGKYGITCNCVFPNARTQMTENLDELLRNYRYDDTDGFRALGESEEAAPLVVLLASDSGRRLNGLFLSLAGDKLSIWDRAREVRCAFKSGGWTLGDLERSLEFALGSDLNTGWQLLEPAPSTTSGG